MSNYFQTSSKTSKYVRTFHVFSTAKSMKLLKIWSEAGQTTQLTLAAHSFLWNLECLHSRLKTSDPGIMATLEKMHQVFWETSICMSLQYVGEKLKDNVLKSSWQK